MRAIVIDGHPLMQDAVLGVLRSISPTAETIKVLRLSQLLDATRICPSPSFVCMDLDLPDSKGLRSLFAVKEIFSETPIVIFADAPAVGMKRNCMKNGATAYVEKMATRCTLAYVISEILGIPVDHSSRLAPWNAPKLTPRQQEIVRLLSKGATLLEIANFLDISEFTVKTHLTRLYEKIGASSRTQAIQYARVHGYIS